MATYDSYAPYVQGMQWVPIKEEPQQLSREQSTGYTFTLTAATQVSTARVYVNGQEGATTPPGLIVDIYRRGSEESTGKIYRRLFPCDGGTLEGGAHLFGAATLAECLASMYDSSNLTMSAGATGECQALIAFDTATNSIPASSRVLGVNLLDTYSAPGLLTNIGDGITMAAADGTIYPVGVTNGLETGDPLFPPVFAYMYVSTLTPSPSLGNNGLPLKRLSLGTHTAFWRSINLAQWNAAAYQVRFPFNATVLAKFDASKTSDYLRVYLDNTFDNSYVFHYYANLEVFYSEENRVLSGSTYLMLPTGATGYGSVLLANPTTSVTGNVLPAGDYTVTVRQMESGGTSPTINALRQIYQIPDTAGVRITEWVNGTENAPTVESYDVLPQISLWTSGGTLVAGSHTYGRQIQAPVGTSSTLIPTQGIQPRGLSGATSFPYARFYARRFGTAASTLTLRQTPYSGGLPTWSITSADFDNLPEILDGWRQVDATFAIPPSLNASLVSFEWTSSVNDGTSHWEILGALAYDTLGATTNSSLSASTYGGSTAAASWAHPPYTSADSGGDLVLLLSQQPPTPTGLAVASSSQAVTSYPADCGPSSYVASAVGYHTVTWTAAGSSLPASGFGYYELQRSDPSDDWATIATMSDKSAASFKDYEARVGVVSSYRIRTVNALGFASPWSSTATGTLPAPGATMTAAAGARILILTSSQNQTDGYSVAYAHAYDSGTLDSYTFPEGGLVSYTQPYGRDYPIALHPSERAGVSFQMPVLVDNSTTAVLPGFDALRDLAWATVPYVCVRDELGNRWFASISVESGTVDRLNGTYTTVVKVREISAYPTEVSL